MPRARALDHAIITVRDLDAAGAAWEALGFRVLPRMRHLVAGSANRIVQFADSYIELLGDVESLVSDEYRRLYGGRLAIGDGLTNICFVSDDLVADRDAIAATGIEVGPIASARRPVAMPDGKTEETDTDFFYPARAGHPYAAPFLSQHHRPDTIFIPEYGDHPNTACGIVGVIHYTTTPAEDAAFFTLVSGGCIEEERVRVDNGGIIDMLDAPTLRARYGAALPPLQPSLGGYGVGLRIAVRSLEKCRRTIPADAGAIEVAGGLLIPAEAASGCFLLFDEEV